MQILKKRFSILKPDFTIYGFTIHGNLFISKTMLRTQRTVKFWDDNLSVTSLNIAHIQGQ